MSIKFRATTEPNIRFVVTAVNSKGQRTLAEDRNHLHTYITREEAQKQLDSIIRNNNAADVERYMGTDLEVRPVECYSSGDPQTCWFD